VQFVRVRVRLLGNGAMVTRRPAVCNASGIARASAPRRDRAQAPRFDAVSSAYRVLFDSDLPLVGTQRCAASSATTPTSDAC
jgi:hypothetical protein